MTLPPFSNDDAIPVLHEDNHLLVVVKPSGLLTQSDAKGAASLLERMKERRKTVEKKPGQAFLGLVHRLDRAVSGVVVLAKTSKAAARLSAQFRDGTVRKRYLAVCEVREGKIGAGRRRGQAELWEDRLQKDRSLNRSRVVATDANQAGPAKTARTRATLLEQKGRLALFLLEPLTGRSHQLRVQCAARGLSIVGDRRYGAATRFPGGIALHAHSITVAHPTLNAPIEFVAEPPASWARFPFAAAREGGSR